MRSKESDSRQRSTGGRGRPHAGDRKPRGGRPARSPNTFQEARYFKHLTAKQIPVAITTWGGDELAGRIAYYDRAFLRLTRDNGPNVFLLKKDIKYLLEAQ